MPDRRSPGLDFRSRRPPRRWQLRLAVIAGVIVAILLLRAFGLMSPDTRPLLEPAATPHRD